MSQSYTYYRCDLMAGVWWYRRSEDGYLEFYDHTVGYFGWRPSLRHWDTDAHLDNLTLITPEELPAEVRP